MKTYMKIGIIGVILCMCSFQVNAQLTQSKHPIVKITTNGNVIQDDPKVSVTFQIIDNGAGVMNNTTDLPNGYDGYCGIETRGNSTQGHGKDSYSVELWTAGGVDTSAIIMSMPKEEDWILHANHFDRTFIQNIFSYRVSASMGHYAPRARFCEVLIDGNYQGLYIMTERIKRDNDRVDIAKLDADDNAGDSLTGGYIIELDWWDTPSQGWYSDHNSMDPNEKLLFQYFYPKASNITTPQAQYIKDYMTNFEDALFSPTYQNSQGLHYTKYMDITSFADLFILNELSRSVDAYKLSSYLYKDKDSKGGKLTAGPVWDFDNAYGNADYCGGNSTSGWTYQQSEADCDDFLYMPMWWDRLMNDTLFVNHVKCRWEMARTGVLHLDSINDYIDLIADSVDLAQQRNFNEHPILSTQLHGEPMPLPGSYAGEITRLKTWLTNRIAWMDSNLPGICANDIVGINENDVLEAMVYPNPADDRVTITIGQGQFKARLYSINGELLDVYASQTNSLQIDLEPYAKGVYLLSIEKESGSRAIKKLVID